MTERQPLLSVQKGKVIKSSQGVEKKEFIDEILEVEYMKGFKRRIFGNFIYWTAGIFTIGLFFLACYWFDKFKLRLRNRRCNLKLADKVLVKGTDKKYELCKIHKDQRMIIFRHIRYYYHEESDSFERARFNSDFSIEELRGLLKEGVNDETRAERVRVHGPNVIDFPVPSIPKLLLAEVLHPFFIFQIYSVVLWCFEEYYYYAAAILFIATVSAVLTLRETRANLQNLRSIARHEVPINVLRHGHLSTSSSMALVPGDIVEVTHKLMLPCDVVLLQGQAVLNESMLTGESIPVVKVPVNLNGPPEEHVRVGIDPRTVLFGGTQVVKLQPAAPHTPVLGMVSKCGFETTKGALILSILFPKPSHFQFFRESLKFLGVLCTMGTIGFSITVYWLIHKHLDLSTVIIRALDLITIVVPPALPMAMTVGTGFALMRMKKMNIFCISPPRINMAGKIEVFCFDKTGTLTADGLDLLGLHPSENASFGQLTMDLTLLPKHLLHTMAACHTITTVDGELIGDPLEVRVFQSAQASIVENGRAGYQMVVSVSKSPSERDALFRPTELGIVECFEFQSALQRMSVVVQDLTNAVTEPMVFVKGSPEMIQMLAIPETLPPNFAEQLGMYTNSGYRVLGCGYKRYSGPLKGQKKEVIRAEVEKDLIFLGFIVLENKLKVETAPVLAELKKARIRCIMVTGDNVLTAVSVARECRLISQDLHVFMGDKIRTGAAEELQWHDVSSPKDEKLILDPYSLEMVNSGRVFGDYAIAVTGKMWEHLYAEFQAGDKKRFVKMLEKGAVFARMTPDQKAALVEELQKLGLYVAMCGDGANDCAALKTAHVGISLSEAEASIAAPFTSTRPNIQCTPNLIREGRASLAVSFKLFQYMGMYSMIQFTTVILLYFKLSVLGNYQYLYQDLAVVFPIVIFMGMTKPCTKLSIKRPSGRLISGAVVGSLLSHVLVCASFQVFLFFIIQLPHNAGWYREGNQAPPGVKDDDNIWIYHMTVLWTFANFQYLIMAFVYSWGKPFLKPIYTNKLLFFTVLGMLGVSTWLLFGDVQPVWRWIQLLFLPMSFRLTMFYLLCGNFVICVFVEWLVLMLKLRKRNFIKKQKRTFMVV